MNRKFYTILYDFIWCNFTTNMILTLSSFSVVGTLSTLVTLCSSPVLILLCKYVYYLHNLKDDITIKHVVFNNNRYFVFYIKIN